MLTTSECTALVRALELAAAPGVSLGPNPRVGCVILDPQGALLGQGRHRGAGTPHAEVDALTAARAAGSTRGATAVVTLEPCTHAGRTGPCVEALVDAGIRRVVVARRDPNLVAAGGIEQLRDHGVEVIEDVPADLAEQAAALNRAWEHGIAHGRPLLTAKLALTLDGRAAAADGTSQWITGPAARAHVHQLRSFCDVVLVGTGTVKADLPLLTARHADGSPHPRQPLRAVMGLSDHPPLPTPPGAGEAITLRTREPAAALAELFARGRRHVLLEAGPTLCAAFLTAGLVDELILHLAPTLLGAGLPAVGDLGISTLEDRFDLQILETITLTSPDGRSDLCLSLRPRTARSH